MLPPHNTTLIPPPCVLSTTCSHCSVPKSVVLLTKPRKCSINAEEDIKGVKCINTEAITNQDGLLYTEPPLKCRDAGWQLGTRPTHWTTKWEKWPAFTSSFKNSFTSCQIPLWPGTCTGAAGQDWACVLAKLLSAWPGSPVQCIPDSPVSRFSGFSPSFFPPCSIFHTTVGVLLAEQVIIGVPETSLLLFYTITVQ